MNAISDGTLVEVQAIARHPKVNDYSVLGAIYAVHGLREHTGKLAARQGRLPLVLSPLYEDRSRVGMHANKRRSCHAAVDEGRKRVRLIAASVLAARKF